MAVRTKAQIITETLEWLGALEAQEAVSAEDSDKVGRKYDLLFEELEEEGLAYWGSDEVPNALAHYVTVMLAADCAPDFTSGLQEALAYVQARAPAMSRIRQLTARPDTGEPTPHLFF